MGGRSAGRSTAGSQLIKTKLFNDKEYFRCAMMRYIYGDIKNSIFQDTLDRIEEDGDDDRLGYEQTGQPIGFTYKKNKVVGIGFKKSSGDQKSKLKSLASYNTIVVEEADEIAEEDFMQLDDSIRTVKGDIMVVLLLNPPERDHWIVRRWFNLIDVPGVEGFYKPVLKDEHRHNTIAINTSYLDNIANIAPSSIANFESYKDSKPDYYWNMIKGYISDGARGRIYKNWKPITYAEFKELPYPPIYGLDFGFSNDPAALVELKMHNNKVWAHELIYETGLHNVGAVPNTLSKRFEDLGMSGADLMYGDSAELKSIEELCADGWYVEPAVKGPGSVSAGIDLLQGLEVYYTEESPNIARESREYKWRLDRNKLPTGNPEDGNDHCMDAIRYGVYSHRQSTFVGFASK
ncbi:MAG: putative terminase large subunit [Prokaryotic dsDNA virus sp.]|nr:MAG: putative terminase large subunit [Prokaryotic dsDNA virus sp.]